MQLKKFPDIPVSTREESGESLPHPEEPRFRLLAREQGSFPCVVGKEFPRSRRISSGGACQGPAPVDPGNSKGGRRWCGKTCLFINVRLG